MAASRVGLLYNTPITSTTNSTTIAGATSNAVAAGDTVFFAVSQRGAATGAACSLSGLPGDAVVEATIVSNVAGSRATYLIRVYFPTGMAASTSVTATLDSSSSRKTMQGSVWTGVKNQNAVATQTANGTTNSPNAGTTAATSVNGVHVASWGINSTVGTNTFTEADTVGAMTEDEDQLVGASTFHYGVEASLAATPQAGGYTATVTVTGTAIASWCGAQGVWEEAAAAGGATRHDLAATGVGV